MLFSADARALWGQSCRAAISAHFIEVTMSALRRFMSCVSIFAHVINAWTGKYQSIKCPTLEWLLYCKQDGLLLHPSGPVQGGKVLRICHPP